MGIKKDENTAENVSKSMQKRIDRANQNKKAKRSALTGRIISGIILALVAAGIIYLISAAAVKAYNSVSPSSDYSKYLDDNGYVKGITAASCVTLPEYKGVKIPKSEIEYSDEEVQSDIDSQLEQHMELSTDTDKKIEDGDKINLDYVGTIDGVEFEGGNSNGQGSDLTIGSGTFIDDFEQQLIGSGVGDNVKVNVTFPDDYQSADLAGKDAQFDCTINGIYIAPEFTDDFVTAYLADKATTVEEYKQYLKERGAKKEKYIVMTTIYDFREDAYDFRDIPGVQVGIPREPYEDRRMQDLNKYEKGKIVISFSSIENDFFTITVQVASRELSNPQSADLWFTGLSKIFLFKQTNSGIEYIKSSWWRD